MSEMTRVVVKPLQPGLAGNFLRFFFLDAGFAVLGEHQRLTVVRKLFAGAA